MLRNPNTMRILALPLTTPLRGRKPPGPMTYFHFQLPPEPEGKRGAMKWVTTKTASLWAGFGQAEEGHWKRRIFQFGERLIDRVDVMEMSLASVDPSLGPQLPTQHPSGFVPVKKDSTELQSLLEKSMDATEATGQCDMKIPLIYPGVVFTGDQSPVQYLNALLIERGPRHRRNAFLWLSVSPLTVPFMLIPVIPNLPFFFCAWRAWSNYKAYKASQYIGSLIQRGAVVQECDARLDDIYQTSQSCANGEHVQPGSDEASTARPARTVLARQDIPRILSLYELPSTAAADMYRAIEQAAPLTEAANARS